MGVDGRNVSPRPVVPKRNKDDRSSPHPASFLFRRGPLDRVVPDVGRRDTRGFVVNRVSAGIRRTIGELPGAYWTLWVGTLVNRFGGFVVPFLALYLTQHRGLGI